MRVVVLSSVFPNPKQPTFGVFIRERVRRVARQCELVVVAPVPWFPLNGRIRGPLWSGIPLVERQGELRVFHPRFLCVPRYLKWLDGILYAASLLPFLARLRREFPFDLIDAHFAYPDGMAAVLLGKVFRRPVTVTIRGTIVPLSKFHLRRMQIRWALANAARIFAVSRSLKEVAVSLGVPPEKVRVIPNGVDTAAFRHTQKEEARRKVGLPLDRAVILSVGSLCERKGHHRVLEALPQAVAERQDILYVVVGGPGVEGDIGPLLRRRMAELGLERHVTLVGARPHEEIPFWLNAADVFCLATSNEGRANVILEAVGCGVPVVTTRVGGTAEIVEEGANGLLVPLGDRDALARALLRAIATEWNRERIAAHARTQSWDRTTEQILEEFRRLVPAAGANPALAVTPEETTSHP